MMRGSVPLVLSRTQEPEGGSSGSPAPQAPDPEEPSSFDGTSQGEPREPASVLGSVEAPAVLVYSDPGGIDAAERGIIEEGVRYLNGPYGPRRLELAVPLAVPGALAEREVSGHGWRA